MSGLRVATVGCGYFSQFHHEAWRRLGVELVGVCDKDSDKANEFSSRYGAQQWFNDFSTMLAQTSPDLIDIILPPAQHLEHIKLACQASETVICQKPFTENLSQVKQAIAIAENVGCKLVVHENFRFQPWYRKVRQLIADGHLGRLFQIRFDLRPGDGQGKRAYLERQPYFQQMEQFLIRETGIHFIDLFRFLGGEVKSVWADLRQLNPAIKGEDAGMFVLEMSQSLRAVFDGNRLCDHVADNRRLTMGEMIVEGELATLSLTGDGRLFIKDHGSNAVREVVFAWQDKGFAGDCVYLTQKHVLDHLHGRAELENSAADYLKNLEIQALVYRSNDKGKRLQV